MNRVALDLGFIQIYWYSIMIILGMLLGMFIVYQEARRRHVDEEYLINLVFYTVLWAIIGARIYYVVFEFSYYSKHLLEIFEIWNGGLAIHGAILFGTVYVIIKTRKAKTGTLKLLDIFCIGLLLGQAIGRWGNFFNGEAFGPVTTKAALVGMHLPKFIIDGMLIDGAYRVPTFLYESVWNLIGVVLLLFIRNLIKRLKVGQLTGFYLVWYSAGRFVIEGMRQDSLWLGSLRIAQVVSVIMIVIGLILIVLPIVRKNSSKLYRDDGSPSQS